METKWRLLEFLIARRREGKRIAGYGAPGKGNTLLNYCGIRTDLLEFTVDRNPYKQGQFLPGTRIPIRHPDALEQARPDYILILPWNLKDEIVAQLSDARRLGRAVRRPDPGGGGPVKVVIFCGGQGLRMREASEVAPKPMIPVGAAPGSLARDEVLRALRVHRLRALPWLQGRGDQALLPDLQRGDGERLRPVGWRSQRPRPEDGHPRLEHHLRRHRAAQLDRAAAARRAGAPRGRRALPRELRRHADRCGPAVHDRASEVDGGDGQLPGGPAELQLPRGLGDRTTASWRTSAT